MKKILLSCLLVTMFQCSAFSSDYQTFMQDKKDYGRYTEYRGGKRGLVDNQGNVILDFKYDDILCKKEDVVSEYFFKLDKKWGVIDEKGKVLLELTYDNVSERDGLFIITINGKQGVVDKNLKQILPTEFDEIYVRDNIITVQKDNKTALYSRKGELIVPLIFESVMPPMFKPKDKNISRFVVHNNYKFGLIDEKGNVIIPLIYDDIKSGNYFAEVRKGDFWGLFDLNGKKIFDIKYTEVSGLIDDTAYAIDAKGKRYEYCLTKESEEEKQLRDEIKNVYSNSGNATVVAKDGEIFFTNPKDKKISKNKYDSISIGEYKITINDTENLELINKISKASDKNAKFVVSKDRKFGCVDKNGNVVIDLQYILLKELDGKRFLAYKGDTMNIIDDKNTVLKSYEFDYITAPKEILSEHCWYILQQGKKWIVLNNIGEISAEIECDEIKPKYLSNELLYICKKNGKTGLFDKTGAMKFDFIYNNIEIIGESDSFIIDKEVKPKFKIRNGNEILIYNYNGDFLFKVKAEDVTVFAKAEYAIIKANNTLTVCDWNGKPVNSKTFKTVERLQNKPNPYSQYAIVTGTNGKLGLINDYGKLILDTIYDDIFFDRPLVQMKINKKYGYHNLGDGSTSECKYESISQDSSSLYDNKNVWILHENGNKSILDVHYKF